MSGKWRASIALAGVRGMALNDVETAGAKFGGGHFPRKRPGENGYVVTVWVLNCEMPAIARVVCYETAILWRRCDRCGNELAGSILFYFSDLHEMLDPAPVQVRAEWNQESDDTGLRPLEWGPVFLCVRCVRHDCLSEK